MDKKKITEKQFIIIMSVPVAVIMIFILYSMFFKNSTQKDIKEINSKSSALILPDVKNDTSDFKKSKSSVYDELEIKEKTKKEQEQLKSSKDFFDMNDKTYNNSENITNNTPSTNNTKDFPSSPSKKNNSNTTTGKKITSNYSSPVTTSAVPKTIKNEDNSNDEYSFGVYKNTSTKSTTSTATNDYIPAILEKSQKIKNGTEVVFILQKDAIIDGKKFEKMSIMYGICSFNSTRVDITINTIQDKAGEKYPVSLSGYNENYQKGIFYSDADATIKQSKSNIFSSTSSKVKSGTVVNGVIQATQNAIQNQKADVDVSQGYKMYFK